MSEIWKKIDGYENYSVSSYGNVRNDKRGKVLKPSCSNAGYPVVNLSKNGKCKMFCVHRLVAKAFIPNPHELPCIDHIDTIRTNNNVENLRWCTQKENCNNPLTRKNNSKSQKGKKLSKEHRQKIGEAEKGEKNPRCRKVILLNTMEVFDYIKQASEKYEVPIGNICKCCEGKRKSAGKLNGEKLVWKYLEDFIKE